jgi:hypothetical protein
MSTLAGSGASTKRDSREAALEATRQALDRLKGERARFGFIFASPERDLGVLLRSARELCHGAELVGCTTAGEITERGLTHGGVAVLLVASDAACCSTLLEGLREDPRRVAGELSGRADELRRTKADHERRHLTTVLLVDGLAGSGEKLVLDLYELSQGGTRIVGGAAGDEGKFEATHVGLAERAVVNGCAALQVFDRTAWGVGVNHGLRSTTRQMRVTRAEANVVFELDGEPAFQAYASHARARGVTLTPSTAAPYLVGNELGIHFFEKISRVRAPLSAGADGSLSCAADIIPRGSMVSILDGEPDAMVEAASRAALEAKHALGDRRAAAVLLFDCVCRGMILKEDFTREIAAVRKAFGDVPIAGFLTYGEIARYGGNLDGWHNATAVVVAIPE